MTAPALPDRGLFQVMESPIGALCARVTASSAFMRSTSSIERPISLPIKPPIRTPASVAAS
ncbi:MAG: hypothetical protein QNI93_09590 [Kiloniellales bacterium]|nr:hypothetical protein [Kiloniellales bacterium]